MNSRWVWRAVFIVCLVSLAFQVYGLKRSYDDQAKHDQEMNMSQKEWEEHFKK